MEGEQPSWNYSTFELNPSSDCYFNPNFEYPIDQNDPLESSLSSLVSSPTASNAGDGFVIRDVIGKLGSICNSGEVSPQSCIAGSRNTSCYNTPLNSPPKLNLSNLGLAPLNADPGFVERAAKFSCFGSELGYGSMPKLEPGMGDSREGSSVSEQKPNARKRKANPKSKASVKEDKVGAEKDESSNAKRSKSNEEAKTDVEETKKETAKAEEAPKDYIHVRARRGQATDSHSLAERVRREKISERMKFLQDLVPGCNKVTGKAVVLDEIINYVQSLQRQVEFLSMKLSTVNSRMDFEALMSKDMSQLPQNMLPFDSLAPALPYDFNMEAAIRQSGGIQMPSTEIPSFWEDDLHSLVQMGFPLSQLQNLQGANPNAQMKIEH